MNFCVDEQRLGRYCSMAEIRRCVVELTQIDKNLQSLKVAVEKAEDNSDALVDAVRRKNHYHKALHYSRMTRSIYNLVSDHDLMQRNSAATSADPKGELKDAAVERLYGTEEMCGCVSEQLHNINEIIDVEGLGKTRKAYEAIESNDPGMVEKCSNLFDTVLATEKAVESLKLLGATIKTVMEVMPIVGALEANIKCMKAVSAAIDIVVFESGLGTSSAESVLGPKMSVKNANFTSSFDGLTKEFSDWDVLLYEGQKKVGLAQ